MAPNLLQKTSNRYLQLTLPENLIPNKRIGKREKLRTRLPYNVHSRIERELCREWLFSWNTFLKGIKREEIPLPGTIPLPTLEGGPAPAVKQPPQLQVVLKEQKHALQINSPVVKHKDVLKNSTNENTLKLNAPFLSFKWSGSFPRFLVTPNILIWNINGAVGGNLFQYFTKYIKNPGCSAPLLSSGQERATPILHLPTMKKSGAEENEKGLQRARKCARRDQGNSLNSGELFVDRAPFLLCFVDQNYNPFSTGQKGFNNFRFIYSLDEKRRGGTKRDKINDDYRNRLAEWRKIGFFYGDLPKRAVVRIMHQAGKLKGNRDSNFLSLLETRLDVTLRRAFFFSTIKTARQWIIRGKILVNNKECRLSGYLLRPGDFVSITEWAHNEFRKQWESTFSVIKNSVIKEHQGYNSFSVSGLHQTTLDMPRRFPFSPTLMRKWKEWSQLWSISKQKKSFLFNKLPKQIIPRPLQPHQEKQKEMGHTLENPERVQHFSFSSSFAFYYSAIKKEKANALLGGATGAGPLVSSLLGLFGNAKRVGKYTHTNKQQIDFSLFQRANNLESKKKEKTAFTQRVLALQPSFSGINAPFRKESSPFLFNAIPENKKLIQQLYQEHPSIIDGCFPQRWNRVFAKKKPVSLRQKHWRWSCLKPLHLECCYKHHNFIFLYSPQKLAWPGSINVSLLWKQLGG